MAGSPPPPPPHPVDANTTLVGVMGHPVRHSLSPALHNAAYAALGLDWVYVAFPVPAGQGAAAVAAMRTLDLAGLSVTMPHKADVVGGLDRLGPTAARLGVVNTISWRTSPDGWELEGDSTDGAGLILAGGRARTRRSIWPLVSIWSRAVRAS